MGTDIHEVVMVINSLHSLLIDAIVHNRKELEDAVSEKLSKYIAQL
jgi:hypothetical protein